MPKVTPQEGAKKLIQNAKAAAPYIAAQVDKVTESPTLAAARAIPKMQQKFEEAIASGKVKRGMERVTKEQWVTAMKTKGIPRISAGLDAAAGKIEAFNQEFYPFLDQVQSQVKAMPSTTLEDNIARMTANVRGIAKFRRGGG